MKSFVQLAQELRGQQVELLSGGGIVGCNVEHSVTYERRLRKGSQTAHNYRPQEYGLLLGILLAKTTVAHQRF